MLQVRLAADVKGNPAGIGNPMVLLCQTFCQERIANWPGKWDVNDPAHVYVPHFRVSESEFPTYKTMGMHFYARPRGHLGFERLQVVHAPHSIGFCFRCLSTSAGSSDGTRLLDPSQNEVRFILVRWNFIKQRAFGLNIPQTLEDILWSLEPQFGNRRHSLPNPEPRVLREHFVMPSIRQRRESRLSRSTSRPPQGDEDWSPRYNVAPTQPVPVIRQNPKEPIREMSLMRWGLIPSWAKDPSVAAGMINARSETAATKPAFRDAMKSRKWVIPADGFYE
jgi:hypothetical protein